jgi:hypothetical protein
VETVNIIALIFKNNWWKVFVFIGATSLLLYVSVPVYFYVTEKNTANPYQYEYPPERAGKFIQSVKNNLPEVKEMVIVSPHPVRQMKFYAKKYQYADSTVVNIYKSWPEGDLTGKNILICEDSIEAKMESNYRYTIIYQEKYCKLYHVEGVLTVDSSSVTKE